ncbi:MAG TPA: FAD-binding protein [Acidimicrobiales bacterium]|nr:FAD-binding protein [Acidimicrobiales bacterium]
MKIAALVKQVPKFEEMQLGADGRLVRDGLELELNPYCRRAVSKGVELAAATGGTCTIITLGPPAAEDVLREAIAWGADRGVLVTDRLFAGSDTLATARALAAVLEREGPFDLVLAGRNSVDADTGQVGPEVAELLDLPFVTGVKRLDLGEGQLKVLCEEDDGHSERVVQLPAVVSTAERLIEPAKVDPDGRAAVDAGRITTVSAADLGPGPWGQDGSGTYVGEVRLLDIERAHVMLDGPVDEQVDEAVRLLVERGALDMRRTGLALEVPSARGVRGEAIAVVVEADRENLTRELLAAGASIAREIGGHVIAFAAPPDAHVGWLAGAGADALVVLDGAEVEEDVAAALASWAAKADPWAVLLPSTAWGREVAGRAAARLGAGLTGDAVGLEMSESVSTGEVQLLAWKPAFGGRLVAAIYASSPIQMVTVRAGVLPRPAPRSSVPPIGSSIITTKPRGRVRITSSSRDDDVDLLATAQRVVCVGAGVPPEDYADVQPLLDVLDAELAATRKVTDKGWQPRARQVGITGRSIAPRLYVAIGLSGKFNHSVGVRAAGTILAINSERGAPIWDHADIGIVGEWRDIVPRLTARLREQRQ